MVTTRPTSLFAIVVGLVACDAPPVPESVAGIVEPGEADALAVFMGTREE